MAETSSGWLKPGDLSDRAVARRALNLLADHLDEDQQEQAERHGGFVVSSGELVFWIPLQGSPRCAHPNDGRVERLCIAPDRTGGMPEGDIALTYLLWIKFDPHGFLREANVLSSKKIEWPDSETDLIRILGDLARPPAPLRTRARRKKPARRRTNGLCLDAAQVRAVFHNHGKEVPPDLLRKLTRS